MPLFIESIQYKNSVDTQRMRYMQDMDPGPAKMLHKPEKGDTSRSRMKRPAAEHGSKTQELISKEHQNYLPSNTHLEGTLSSKYYLRLTG